MDTFQKIYYKYVKFYLDTIPKCYTLEDEKSQK